MAQLAQNCYLVVHRLEIEPWTFRSRIQRLNCRATKPPNDHSSCLFLSDYLCLCLCICPRLFTSPSVRLSAFVCFSVDIDECGPGGIAEQCKAGGFCDGFNPAASFTCNCEVTHEKKINARGHISCQGASL